MSTATAPVNAKINTIQPIEGARGNIALFYYQGKYPIYKSLDDGLYNLNSVIDAFKASTNINIAKCKVTKWLSNDATKRLIAYLCKIDITEDPPIEFSNWYISSKSTDLESFLLKFQKRSLSILVKKWRQTPELRHLDGWYGCEKLMLDLAGWLDKGFHCEIYDVFAMSAERERLNTDINHKQETIDELKADVKRLLQQNEETHQKLNETKQQLTDANHKLDTIKADMRSIAPVASGLTNRVSSPLSEEYLLINYTENDNGTVNVTYNAVNPTTIKSLKINVEDSWLHQRFANAVDAQNRLLELIEQDHLNIGRINRRAKSFIMNIVDLETLTNLVTDTLPTLLNKESVHIKNKANKNKETPPPSPSEKHYMGYPLDYCKRMCKRYSVTMETLTDIINKEYTYGPKKYPIRLHPTDGIVYGKSINGKRRWYILKDDTFMDD